jgi:arginase
VSTRLSSSLRLLFPQWQGTPVDVLNERLPELTKDQALSGHSLGGRLLQLLAPESETPVAEVPVDVSRQRTAVSGGIYARDVLLKQLRAALEILAARDPGRVLTLGGDCSVSIAPFSHLARRNDGDLAVLWLDAHPDLTTPGDEYTGFHAMALATLLGVGDAEFTRALPAHLDPAQVLLVGLRAGEANALERQVELGIAGLAPADVAGDSAAVLGWLRSTGASRVAIHLDLDVVDSRELASAAALESAGLSLTRLIRLLGDISDATTVVGFTVADHLPRTEILLRDLLGRLPLR